MRKILFTLLMILASSASFAGWAEKVDQLVKEGKYLSAAEYLRSDEAFATPGGLKRYVSLLISFEASSSNFHAFSMRDLAQGETIEEMRKAPGETKVVETDLEELLFARFKEKPADPDVNFAVGEYLSRMQECGCGAAKLFPSEPLSEVPYFLKAFEKGVSDAWSLFRLGLGFHISGDLARAMEFYRLSIAKDETHLPSYYNLAVVLFMSGNADAAKVALTKALDKYPDDRRNADAHHLAARIAEAKNLTDEAQAHYDRTFILAPSHEMAAPDYMDFLRRASRLKEYGAFVERYLGLDWSAPSSFNVYIDYLSTVGPVPEDRAIYENLLKLKFTDPQKTGALNYGMGKLATVLGESGKALDHYKKSLEAFGSMASPPEGAVEALKSLIGEASAPK